MRLPHIEGATYFVRQKSQVDLTKAMHAFPKSRVEALAAEDLTLLSCRLLQLRRAPMMEPITATIP